MGRSVSSDRSATSSAKASETRRPVPLFRHQQTRPGVVCCSDDGLHLVSFKVLRQRLGYKFLVLVNSLRMLAEGLRRREIMVVGSVVMAGILR